MVNDEEIKKAGQKIAVSFFKQADAALFPWLTIKEKNVEIWFENEKNDKADSKRNILLLYKTSWARWA